jgi:hypothetical protein
MEEIEFKVDEDLLKSVCKHRWASYKSVEYHLEYYYACVNCGKVQND